jgi:transcriptional regulator with XRE-family HTH domain
MITEVEAERFRRVGRPEIWTPEGTRLLGKLIRESRGKFSISSRRHKGITTSDLAIYIAEIMAIRGTPFEVSEKTIQSIEGSNPKIPRHNTMVAIAAAQFICHPTTNELFSLAQLSLIASGLYDPYTDEIKQFDGVANPEKSAILLNNVVKKTLMTNPLPHGVRNLAATLKIARLDRGVSVPDLCNRVREATGIEISVETLREIEAGAGEIGSDVLMALAAYEYAINPHTERPYTIQDILNILNERLEPLNPRTNRLFTEMDFEFLEISSDCHCDQHHRA